MPEEPKTTITEMGKLFSEVENMPDYPLGLLKRLLERKLPDEIFQGNITNRSALDIFNWEISRRERDKRWSESKLANRPSLQEKKQYRFYVSYSINGGGGFGGVVIRTDYDILTEDDIDELSMRICKGAKLNGIIILFIKELQVTKYG
jgi:hypothetical protein